MCIDVDIYLIASFVLGYIIHMIKIKFNYRNKESDFIVYLKKKFEDTEK